MGVNKNSPATALDVDGTVTALGFAGSGASLTALNGGALATGSVSNAALAANTVTSDKIADAAIQPADLNLGSFSSVFWKADGNAGTQPDTQFLGTTDNQPLELRVNNNRALRMEPISGGPNLIGGHPSNCVAAGVNASVIAGGGHMVLPNRIESRASAIGGGTFNRIQFNAGVSTIGGGYQNTNLGWYAAIPGGYQNVVADYSFAAGRRARALHSGSLVWADSTDTDFATTAGNQFLIRASGGVGIGTNNPQSLLHVAGTVRATDFASSGAGLNSLNADRLASGTLPDARLSADVALLNSSPTFTGSVTSVGDLQGMGLKVGSGHTLTGKLATIAGGYTNTASGDGAFAGGGGVNLASQNYASVSGGQYNTASGGHATVAGVYFNTASSPGAFVGGGEVNQANNVNATVAGGTENVASGNLSTVSGGENNTVLHRAAARHRAARREPGGFLVPHRRPRRDGHGAVQPLRAAVQAEDCLRARIGCPDCPIVLVVGLVIVIEEGGRIDYDDEDECEDD